MSERDPLILLSEMWTASNNLPTLKQQLQEAVQQMATESQDTPSQSDTLEQLREPEQQ